MKATKMSLVLALALALSLSLASSSWARPCGAGGPGALNLTPEQVGKLFDLKHKFMNDNAELCKQMLVKRAELAALWKADKPDEKAIVAKQKELNALRDQMQEKSVALRLEARRIAPQLPHWFGHGMEGGMGGHGCCMGPAGGPPPGPGGPAKAKAK